VEVRGGRSIQLLLLLLVTSLPSAVSFSQTDSVATATTKSDKGGWLELRGGGIFVDEDFTESWHALVGFDLRFSNNFSVPFEAELYDGHSSCSMSRLS